jgi:hypothetical protein
MLPSELLYVPLQVLTVVLVLLTTGTYGTVVVNVRSQWSYRLPQMVHVSRSNCRQLLIYCRQQEIVDLTGRQLITNTLPSRGPTKDIG